MLAGMFALGIESSLFEWVLLPAMIFAARVIDVTLGTLRIIFISRGRRVLAPIMGFFEVLVWLLAISQIFKNLTNPLCYVAYAAGFAGGSLLGIIIESKLALGTQIVRIITRSGAEDLIARLKDRGYGLTTFAGEGATGSVLMIFTIIKRKDLPELVGLIRTFHPKAFYTVEDVRMAREGVYPLAPPHKRSSLLRRLLPLRKGK
jgi:uncharacterized protein YebE (UPF0316 family)